VRDLLYCFSVIEIESDVIMFGFFCIETCLEVDSLHMVFKRRFLKLFLRFAVCTVATASIL
jgi:hypothetical protein